MRDIQKVLMKDFSSLRIGGEVDMVIVTNESELVEVVVYAKNNAKHLHILGGGTNTYFGEHLKDVLVVKMEIRGIDSKVLESDVNMARITVYAGEIWDDIVKYSIEQNLWGLENLSYIPGTAGAAPVQNIGAYGIELKDVLESVRVYDIESSDFMELSNEECHFGYRNSLFKQEKGRYIITAVTLKLSKKANPVLTYKPLDRLIEKKDVTPQDVRDLVIQTRQEKIPNYTIFPNAGSFFKNAEVDLKEGERLLTQYQNIPLHKIESGYKIPAAWLIEHVAEMKGVRLGDVGTWPAQPLILVNYSSATYKDVLLFSAMIIQKIEEKSGIHIEREVNFVE